MDPNEIHTNEGVYIGSASSDFIARFRYFRSDGSGKTDRIIIKSNGNVGIGTMSPAEKLSVNGKIRSKEVKVELANWSDFVFNKDYNLPTLKEVEAYIAAHGHLSDTPMP